MRWRDEAHKRWPTATWLLGSGRFAMLAKCGQSISVTLHLTLQAAKEAKSHADRCGCGDADCKAADGPRAFRYQFARNRHVIVDLAEPPTRHETLNGQRKPEQPQAKP